MSQGFTQAIHIALVGTADLAAFDMATRQLNTLESTLHKASTTLASLGLKSTLFGAGMAFSVGTAIKSAADFESELAMVSTLLTAQTEQYLPKYKKELVDLAASSPKDSLEGLTKALYQTISANVPASDAMRVLTIASQSAAAGLTDTETAVDGITSVLNAYQMSAKEATRVSDIMFMAQNLGKTTFGEMAKELGGVLGTASAAGVSFEEIAAAITTITKRGINTAESVTAINMALQDIIAPSEKAKRASAKFGIELSLSKMHAMGFQKYLQYLSSGVGGSIENIAQLSDNVRGLKAILALTGKNANEAASDLTAMTVSANATRDAFAKVSDTVKAKWNHVTNALATLKETLGEPLLSPMAVVLDKVASIVNAFRQFAAVHPTLVSVGASFMATSASVFLFGGLLLLSASGVTALAANLLAIPTKLSALATAMKLSLPAGTGMLGILKAISGTILSVASPVLIAAGVVAGLFVAWKTNFLGLRDVVTAFWTAIKPLLTALWSTFKLLVTDVVYQIRDIAQAVTGWFTTWNSSFTGMQSPLIAFAMVTAYTVGFTIGLFRGFFDLLRTSPVMGTLLATGLGIGIFKLWGMSSAIGGIISLLKTLPYYTRVFGAELKYLSIKLAEIAANPKLAFEILRNAMTSGAGTAKNFAVSVYSSFLTALKGMWQFTLSAAQGIWQWALSLGSSIAFVVKNLAMLTWNLAVAGMKVVWFGMQWLITKAVMLAHAIATGVATSAQWLLNVAMTANPIGLIIAGVVALGAAFYLLYKHWDTVWGWIKQAALVAVLGIVAPFYLLWKHWDTVLGWLKIGFTAVGDFFSGIWDTVKQAGMNAADWVIEKINWLIGKINSVSSYLGFEIPLIPTFTGKASIPTQPAVIPVEVRTFTKDSNLVHNSPYTILTQQAQIPVAVTLDDFFLRLQDSLTKTLTNLLDLMTLRLEQFVMTTQQLSRLQPSLSFAGGSFDVGTPPSSSSIVSSRIFNTQRSHRSTSIDRSIRIDAINISGVSGEQGESIRDQIIAALSDALSATDGVEEASIG